MEDGGEKKKEGGRAKRAPAEDYIFSGAVIHLLAPQFHAWQASYHAIPDMMAELTALDAWLSAQPEAKRKAWFHTVAGALNRKHQELLAAIKAKSSEPAVPL